MLYIFDLDGTLVEKYGTLPLPNVPSRLEKLADSGHKLAIATNQAGLAWRILTKATKFPDVHSMAQRFEQIARVLHQLKDIPWFISVFDSRVKLHSNQYQNLCTELTNTCPQLTLVVRADPHWRKPKPGMLLSAGQYYNLGTDQIVYVGDYQTDADAAESAGMKFSWAEEFFKANVE